MDDTTRMENASLISVCLRVKRAPRKGVKRMTDNPHLIAVAQQLNETLHRAIKSMDALTKELEQSRGQRSDDGEATDSN